MKQYRISTGTVTFALKGRDILRRNGFDVKIERITSTQGGLGCGYTIVLSGNITQAENILRKSGVKILDISEI